MPMIEGFGDEVVHFAAFVVVMTVAALAWWSTNARPDRYRTVLLMRSPHAHHPVTLSIRTGAPPPTMLYTNRRASSSAAPAAETGTRNAVTVTSASNALESNASSSSEDAPLQEMDSIVDADMALLDNNRLHFYRRVNSPRAVQSAAESTSDENVSHEDTEPASNDQIREMDSIVSAMEGDESNSCDVFSRPNAREEKDAHTDTPTTPEETSTDRNAEGDPPTIDTIANDRKILIRLKYLNDTLKEVEGDLDELLKDFKWRNFSSELSSGCLVRLIYNGRVLCEESATLRALGLQHRAVVHCLVHQGRQNTQRSGGPEELAATPELVAGGVGVGGAARPAAGERTWDLENILMTLTSVALTVVWFFRCEYSNMFTASASIALFGLTVFYSVAIFGLYLSDTFHFDRRPQPVPAN